MVTKEYECIFSLSETYELKRQQHLADLQRKEDEMRQTFVIRVKEKEAQLKETEKEVRINEFSIPKLCNISIDPSLFHYSGFICMSIVLQLHDRFDALKKKHAEEKKKIEDNKTRYENEMQAFQQRKAQHQAQMSTLGKKGKKWSSLSSVHRLDQFSGNQNTIIVSESLPFRRDNFFFFFTLVHLIIIF